MELNIDIVGLIYSIVVIAGGIFGYVKAGSVPSVVAGTISGLVAGYGALFSNFYVLTAVSVVLGGIMAFRFYKTQAIMPAGIIVILSVLLLVRCIVFFVQQSRN